MADHPPCPVAAAGFGPVAPRDARRVLTHSSLKSYRECPRKYELSYVMGYRGIKVAKPLAMGTAIHRAIEAFWRAVAAGKTYESAKDEALVALEREIVLAGLSPFDLGLTRPMIIAYAAAWSTHQWTVLAVEAKFRIEMQHPDGRVSDRFVLEGMIDLILRGPDGVIRLVEHKSSAADVGPGSIYRRRLSRDEQITLYLAGAASLGFDTSRIVYDVLGKPKLSPYKETPVELRKYTQEKWSKPKYERKTKANPEPKMIEEPRLLEPSRLYSGQHDRDETLEEFERRVAMAIAEDPEAYIVRIRVDRTVDARKRFHLNVWNQAGHLASDLDDNYFSENTGSCDRHGGACSFAPHCLDGVPLNDPYVFRKIKSMHEELAEDTVEASVDEGTSEVVADW